MAIILGIVLLSSAAIFANKGEDEEEAAAGNVVSVFGAFRDEEAYRFEESMKHSFS